MKRLKDRIERRTGVIWGTFRTPPQSRADHRLLIRAGAGKDRHLVNFEAGVAGRTFYFSRTGRR